VSISSVRPSPCSYRPTDLTHLIYSTIADIYPKEVRGSKLSTYGLAVIIAPAFSPLICSLVVNEHDWPIVYWIVLAFGGLQFLLFFFLVPETLWNESEETVDGQVRVQDVSENGIPVQRERRHLPIGFERCLMSFLLTRRWETWASLDALATTERVCEHAVHAHRDGQSTFGPSFT
jgi:MFS family permease